MAQRRILLRPTPFATRLSRGAVPLERLMAPARISYWHNARNALWHGLRLAGLEPGERVLFPAYCCGSELAVLLAAGLEPVFYRVDAQLRPDMDHLTDLAREPARALFVIHYFGIPQPIAELSRFARDRGMLLIEDCAHALFGRHEDGAPLGSVGDLAIMSLRKHLPLPDGGALVMADRTPVAGDAPSAAQQPSVGNTLRKCAFTASQELTHRVPALADRLLGLVPKPPVDDGSDGLFDNARSAWVASSVTRMVVSATDFAAAGEARRHNMATLLARIEPRTCLRPLFARVPAGASPLSLPLHTPDPDRLAAHMAAGGVASYRFWRRGHPAIPREGFALETGLRRMVVAVPVHQGLDPEDLDRIAVLLNAWRPAAGGS